jgi:uncharacterized protein involved in exopolysaccharide biosynthesis
MDQENEIQHGEKNFDVMKLLAAFWIERKFIGIVAGCITVAAVIISLLLPESFKSTAVILPDTDKSKLSALGGLSDLASMAGVSTGDVSIVKLYPTIIKSESVLKNVLYKKYKTKEYSDSVDLIQYWKIKEKTPERSYEVGLKGLQDGLLISSDIKLNVVTMEMSTEEPQLSADILNTVIAELDNFIRTKKKTNASEQRKWIEGRLAEVKSDLETSENKLKDFRMSNRIVSTSPQLLLEQERMLREVQINTTLYTELKKQYELVKIEEIKNIPLISVMDYARPAAKKDKPKRSIIVLTSLLLSLFASGGYVFVRDTYGKQIAQFKMDFSKTVFKK